MELKCLFINNDSNTLKIDISKNVLSDIETIKIKKIDESEIKETRQKSGIIVFRINREGNPERYGVNSSRYKEDVPLNQELGKPIYVQDFIVINTKDNMVYYTGSKDVLEAVLLKYFNLRKEHLNSLISLANVEMIAKIKVIEYFDGQTSVFTSTKEMVKSLELSDVFTSADPFTKSSHEYELRDSKSFRHKLLEELLEDNKSNKLRKYSFEGFDNNGNPINYSDGVLAKKIIIFKNGSHKGYEERKKMSLDELILEIERVN